MNTAHALDPLQRLSLLFMAGLLVLTFVATNMQAVLWQSSDWLVGVVLPAVVVNLTNDNRADTTPLSRSSVLDEAASAKAAHMAEHSYFAHFAPDGTTPWYFFDEAGYVYAHAGENLAIHFSDSAEVVEAWMNSPAHRQNIENSLFTEIGVGTAKGRYKGYDTVFVVQLFGAPAVTHLAVEAPPGAGAALPMAAPRPPQGVPETTPSNPSTHLTDAITAIENRIATLQAADTNLQNLLPTPVALGVNDTAGPSATATNPVLSTSSQMVTSTGLITRPVVSSNLKNDYVGTQLAAVATRPQLVLGSIYLVLVAGTLVLLLVSVWREMHSFHYWQVVYSLLLLVATGGLWYLHTWLTSGAIII